MTADTPAPRANTVSLLAAASAFESMRPSLVSLLGPQFTNVTAGLGSLVLKQIDMSGISKMLADIAPSTRISKMIAEQYAPNVNGIGLALAQMHRVQLEAVVQNVDLKKAIESFNRSFMQSVSTPSVSALLSQATALQDILEDQPDVEQFAAEFLEEQPALAASIEELPFLVTLSSMDRKLIVWFITVVVSIYVTMGLVTIGTDNPELHALLGDLGVGSGIAAGAVVGKGTKKLLDKLPAAEND